MKLTTLILILLPTFLFSQARLTCSEPQKDVLEFYESKGHWQSSLDYDSKVKITVIRYQNDNVIKATVSRLKCDPARFYVLSEYMKKFKEFSSENHNILPGGRLPVIFSFTMKLDECETFSLMDAINSFRL